MRLLRIIAYILSIAAGAFFTLFLARPNDTMSNLYRFPQSVPSEPACLVCHRDDELGLLLECEKASGHLCPSTTAD